jgi:putative thioredoxin
MNTLNFAQADADLIKDSNTKNFVVDVIEASKSVPVLVDFWAPWCGPCKTLGPMIEKVVREAKGKIKLVKVDIDQNPEIAGQMRVQSIPAVFAFVDGRPVDGFMGAIPESQIRQFIAKLGGKGGRAEQIEQALQMARDGFAAGDFEAVMDIASQIIEVEPSTVEAFVLKAKAEMELQMLPEAEATLGACPAEKQNDPSVISAKAALDLLLNPVDTSAIGKFEQAVAANPNDFAARLELSTLLNGSGQREAAIDHLVYVIKKDRTWQDDAARKQLVSYFEAWGPKDEFTLMGRRKLSAVLFS